MTTPCKFYSCTRIPGNSCGLLKKLDRATADGKHWYWRLWHWFIGVYRCRYPYTGSTYCSWYKVFYKEDR